MNIEFFGSDLEQVESTCTCFNKYYLTEPNFTFYLAETITFDYEGAVIYLGHVSDFKGLLYFNNKELDLNQNFVGSLNFKDKEHILERMNSYILYFGNDNEIQQFNNKFGKYLILL